MTAKTRAGMGRVAVLAGCCLAVAMATAGEPGDVLLEVPGDGFALSGGLDANGDGVPDVLVADADGALVARLFSGRDGTEIAHYPADDQPPLGGSYFLGLALVPDMTGDQQPDVMIGLSRGAKSTAQPALAILFDGASGAEVWESAGDHPFELFGRTLSSVGDTTGDGIPEVVVTGNTVIRLLSGADGARVPGFEFTPTQNSGITASAVAAGIGDVNRDGVPDLLIGLPSTGSDFQHIPGDARVISGRNGEVIRRYAGKKPLEFSGRGVAAVGDLDRDGTPDYAISSNGAAGGGELRIYSGRKGRLLGRYTRAQLDLKSIGSYVIGVGDINRDGSPDVLVDATDDAGASFFVVLSGKPSKQPVLQELRPQPNEFLASGQAAAGDVDGDGVSDLIASNGYSLVRVLKLAAPFPVPKSLTLASALQRTPDDDAAISGKVTLSVKRGVQTVSLVTKGLAQGKSLQRAAPATGPFAVVLEDGLAAGTFTPVGSLDAAGKFSVSGTGTVPPGLGVASLADLIGRRVQLRDGADATLLETVVPPLSFTKKVATKGKLLPPPGSPFPAASLATTASFNPKTGALAVSGKIKKAGKGPFVVELETAAGSGTFAEIAQLSGTKLSISTGSGVPLAGAFTVADLVGRVIRIVSGADVVLAGIL